MTHLLATLLFLPALMAQAAEPTGWEPLTQPEGEEAPPAGEAPATGESPPPTTPAPPPSPTPAPPTEPATTDNQAPSKLRRGEAFLPDDLRPVGLGFSIGGGGWINFDVVGRFHANHWIESSLGIRTGKSAALGSTLGPALTVGVAGQYGPNAFRSGWFAKVTGSGMTDGSKEGLFSAGLSMRALSHVRANAWEFEIGPGIYFFRDLAYVPGPPVAVFGRIAFHGFVGPNIPKPEPKVRNRGRGPGRSGGDGDSGGR
jgi:hypothetical protein